MLLVASGSSGATSSARPKAATTALKNKLSLRAWERMSRKEQHKQQGVGGNKNGWELYAEAGCSGEGRWHDQDRNESASGFKFLIEAILGKEGEQ